MDSTPLSSPQESVLSERLAHQAEFSLPFLTPQGRRCYSAHDSYGTSALPPRHITGFSYGLQMPNAHLDDLPSLQDVYDNEIVAEAISVAILSHISLPGAFDLPENHHSSIHNISRSRTDRLPQASMLPPSTLPHFLHPSGNATLGTVFSQVKDIAITHFDSHNPATPSTHTFLDETLSHNATDIPGESTASIVRAPATSDDSSQSRSSSTPSDTDFHTTERIGTASSNTIVEQSITHIPGATQKRWRCCHPDCEEPDKAWRNIHDARNHVRKHLGETILNRCKRRGKNFACEKNARRHQLSQGKKYRCKFCDNMFTRVDFRNKHQKACGTNLKTDTIATPVFDPITESRNTPSSASFVGLGWQFESSSEDR